MLFAGGRDVLSVIVRRVFILAGVSQWATIALDAGWRGNMTPEEHRKLDAQIAEKIMGWKDVKCRSLGNSLFVCSKYTKDRLTGVPEGTRSWDYVLPYSKNIQAAWQVVEKMNDRDDRFGIFLSKNSNGTYTVAFDPWNSATPSKCEGASTAPEAICRAALEAVA